MPLVYIIKSGVCILLVLWLVYKYLKNNQKIVQLLFTAFALKYFAVPIIGPSIDVLYLFSFFIASLEIVSFLSGKTKISKKMLLLFSLPLVLFFLFLTVYSLQKNHFLRNLNPFLWYVKTTANYFKTFLPYFLVGMAVTRQANNIDLDIIFKAILKIATIACWIAVLQLFVFVLFHNQAILLELIGLNGGYNYEYSIGGLSLVRVQAFFYEPKSLAAFLGIAIPIAFFYKQHKQALLYLLVGVLTISQTFFVILLVAFFLFVVLKNVKNVMASIIWSVTLIVMFFFSISSIKNYLLENYATQEETIAYKIFWDRALQRYNDNDADYKQELMGIPLQPDIELPAVNFLRDHQVFLLTGFGPGNYNTIPFKYFVSQWNIDAIEQGIFKGHFDMGWIYLVAEFGLLFFITVFFILTHVKYTGFESRFYAFLWLVFFFHRIDILLISFFCLLFYKSWNRENLYNNNILQPGEVY